MSADFWMGSFVGAVTVLVLLLLIVGRSGKGSAAAAVKSNERAHDLLEKRNQLEETANQHLGTIAAKLDELSRTSSERGRY